MLNNGFIFHVSTLFRAFKKPKQDKDPVYELILAEYASNPRELQYNIAYLIFTSFHILIWIFFIAENMCS